MEITWDDLKKRIMYAKIIDIRENYLYNMVKIKNSLNIPYKFLLVNAHEYLNKKEPYYILCEYGHKSKLISDILNKEGYQTYSIKGGIKSYDKK